MTAQKMEGSAAVADRAEFVNEVRLAGRLAEVPEQRTLAGDVEVVQFRVVVERPVGEAQGGVKPGRDSLECTVWEPRLQKRVLKWAAGSSVEVTGALRRRFWRAEAGVASRTDVEVVTGRLTRRAGSG